MLNQQKKAQQTCESFLQRNKSSGLTTLHPYAYSDSARFRGGSYGLLELTSVWYYRWSHLTIQVPSKLNKVCVETENMFAKII
jgi:hypothetical protein